MIEIRLVLPNRREFRRDVYRPGVISLSRILWGSLGSGIFLVLIALISTATGVGVLYPPLAATCFIGATCTYLRVARPKSVIVGHFIATVGGLAGVAVGEQLCGGTSLAVPVKLGMAVLFSAALMQILDADHPPAAATAAIPAILPLPAPALLLTLHMAWGAVLAVLFGIVWNRFWFECPPPENGCERSWFNLSMDKPDILGAGLCTLATLLMCGKPWSQGAYEAGLGVMLAGLIVMSLHHFIGARVLVTDAPSCCSHAQPTRRKNMNGNWYPTVCYQCKAECAIEARIVDGRVTEVRGNPKFRGKACVKGMAGVTLQYSKDRLTKPLKRIGERGEGKFAEISWDEALDTIEAKLRSLYDRGEAHKLTYSFFPHSLTDPKWHFLNAYGGYINTGLPHCDSAKIVSQIKCWGGIPNHHIPPAWFTMPKDGIMLLAGRHAFGCLDDAVAPRDILEAKDRGAKLIVIDPIFSPDAAKADWWIPIKPSGDTALFLGMINYLIANDLYDKKFVEEWVREGDFEKVKAHVRPMTPEAMSKICDVPARDIVRLAEMCAAAPAVGVDGFKSIMLGQALDYGHAWAIFLAITGNIDNPGGQPLPDLTPLSPVTPQPKGPAPLHDKGFHRTGPNRDKFAKYSFILEPTWYETQAIKDDGLKILLVTEANPALTEMGSLEWQKAVCMKDKNGNYKLEFLLNTDIMLSETGKFADIVLPDQTHFERWELLYMPWWYNFGHGVLLRQPLVDPPGEARHSNRVFIELGKRMFPEYFQFKDDVEYYDIQLKGLGLSVKKLQDMGGRWSPGTLGFHKYRERGFGTPSKKVHLYWEDLEDIGQALPRTILAPEYDADTEKYPFIMVSYRRIHINGTGPWSVNNAQLRDPASGQHTNPAIINTAAAARLGIGDGDTVTISSRTGSVTTPVKLTEHIRPDCIGIMHGFGASVGRVGAGAGVNDNDLIPDAGSHLHWQDLVGGEAHVSTRVRISK